MHTTHNIAVKSFIMNDRDEVLLLKRQKDDSYPGVWEIPGGRVESGEHPIEGAAREAREETSIEIDVLHPLKVHHFKKDEGYLTMLTFFCRPKHPSSCSVAISEEHSDFRWVHIDDCREMLSEFFHEEVALSRRLI